MKRGKPSRRPRTADGMTLAECLVAVAISSIVMAGLAGMMRIGAIATDQGRQFGATRAQAEEVLDRIAWAIATADPKTQDEMKAMSKNSDATSGTWFYGKNSNGTLRTLGYEWNPEVINEVDAANIPRGVLQKVTKFSIKQASSNDAGLVEVRMTFKTEQGEVSYTMVRRLGGAW